MATWGQLVDFVNANYRVAQQTDEMLQLNFSFDNDRTQIVFVFHTPARDGEDWIQIESPIGELDKINLRALLELIGNTVVGGAAARDGYVVLRESVPLADMSVEEFESPFLSITGLADNFEHELTRVDRY